MGVPQQQTGMGMSRGEDAFPFQQQRVKGGYPEVEVGVCKAGVPTLTAYCPSPEPVTLISLRVVVDHHPQSLHPAL